MSDRDSVVRGKLHLATKKTVIAEVLCFLMLSLTSRLVVLWKLPQGCTEFPLHEAVLQVQAVHSNYAGVPHDTCSDDHFRAVNISPDSLYPWEMKLRLLSPILEFP